ncbi:hypothetical protein MML48_5g00008304 [Holotrichia oblita]|uniref:Uncharacterized protein n=1 Tax=Holotrichia oblita TaxID=644536 RepID=A0ACB9T1E3_HOLOL|nr:hypothetical protein MML48_5g00008304 [Holotrichia oblita]
MVYSYKRKTNRGSWNEADMEKALEAVHKGEMGWLKASKTFNVPTATLRRRGLRKNKIAVNIKKHLGSFESALNKEAESAMVNHILYLESRFFGLITTDVRKLAYEVAEKIKIKHPFNKELKMAGKGWLYGFRQRNLQLSLRLPEATSLARAEAFNKAQDSQEPESSRAQALIIFESPKEDQESGTANISPTEPLDHTCPPRSRDDIHKILACPCPFPQSNVRNTTKRKTGCYQDVLTESAYLQSLRDKENEKNQQQSNKKKDVKRKLVDEREKKQQQHGNSQRNVVKRKLVEDDSSGEENLFRLDDDEEDCACLYCNGLFSRSKSKEWWLRCQLCQKWCHVECAGFKPPIDPSRTQRSGAEIANSLTSVGKVKGGGGGRGIPKAKNVQVPVKYPVVPSPSDIVRKNTVGHFPLHTTKERCRFCTKGTY